MAEKESEGLLGRRRRKLGPRRNAFLFDIGIADLSDPERQRKALQKMIEGSHGLSPREREFLTACYLGDESAEKTGKTLGLSGKRVRQVMERGERVLRQERGILPSTKKYNSKRK